MLELFGMSPYGCLVNSLLKFIYISLIYKYLLRALCYNLILLNFVAQVIIFSLFLVPGSYIKSFAFEWVQTYLLAKDVLTTMIPAPLCFHPKNCAVRLATVCVSFPGLPQQAQARDEPTDCFSTAGPSSGTGSKYQLT